LRVLLQVALDARGLAVDRFQMRHRVVLPS
jgi:hypothetical protein